MALLEWSTTATIGMGSSPSQGLFSRKTRGAVPMASSKLDAEVQAHVWDKKTKEITPTDISKG